MAQKTPSRDLMMKQLSASVGDFIRYWGFRRIHGQIWVQIYLSKVPLSGADLVRKLKVSKALVSPALAELEDYGLIRQEGGDRKTKLYMAEPDVFGVIKKILITREREMISRSSSACRKLRESREIQESKGDDTLDIDRLMKLSEMIESASAALEIIIHLTNQEEVAEWNNIRDVMK